MLRSVDAAMPSIVLAADDGEGHALTDVTVRIGGAVVATRLDGRPIELDPGTYDLRFERASGEKVVTVHELLRESEKNRVVRAYFRRRESRGSGHALPVSFAALGAAALGLGLYSRLDIDGQIDQLRSSCAPDCADGSLSIGVGLGALVLMRLSSLAALPKSQGHSPLRALPARDEREGSSAGSDAPSSARALGSLGSSAPGPRLGSQPGSVTPPTAGPQVGSPLGSLGPSSAGSLGSFGPSSGSPGLFGSSPSSH
jgi:hypothetical protein